MIAPRASHVPLLIASHFSLAPYTKKLKTNSQLVKHSVDVLYPRTWSQPSQPNPTLSSLAQISFLSDLHSGPWISWRKSAPWRVKTQRPLNLNVTVWKHHTRQKNQLIRVVSSYAQRNLWIDVDQTWSNVHVRMRWINVSWVLTGKSVSW